MKLKEALGLIPDTDVAQRAVDRAPMIMHNVDVPDSATALERGFLFPATAEGAPYWRSVVAALRANTVVPRLPGSRPTVAARNPWALVPTEVPVVAPQPLPLPTSDVPALPPAPDGMQWVRVPVTDLVPEGNLSARVEGTWAWCYLGSEEWNVRHGGTCGFVASQQFARLVPIADAVPATPAVADVIPDHLPPLPPAPDGGRWVYVGTGVSGLPLPYLHTDGSSWISGLAGVSSGTPSLHYCRFEAAVTPVPPELPPFPEAPEGKEWVYVGMGVNGLTGVGMWAACMTTTPWSLSVLPHPSTGHPNLHYIKLVAKQCAETCTPNPESGDDVQETAPLDVPYPPVPEGYDHWEYRGFGFNSGNDVVRCAIREPGDRAWSVWSGDSCATGNERVIYIEAVKESHAVPVALLPLPPLPEGFRKWVYRGKGWQSDGVVTFMCYGDELWDTEAVTRRTAGMDDLHYIEAVKEPLTLIAGRSYVQHDGVVRHLDITEDVGSTMPFFDGLYHRTVDGRLFRDPSVNGPHDYVAEVTTNQERN